MVDIFIFIGGYSHVFWNWLCCLLCCLLRMLFNFFWRQLNFHICLCFNSHTCPVWLVEHKCRRFSAQNHLSCTIPTSGTIAKVTVSVVTLTFPVIFGIVGPSISENLCPVFLSYHRKEKKIGNLWDVVIDVLIKAVLNLAS